MPAPFSYAIPQCYDCTSSLLESGRGETSAEIRAGLLGQRNHDARALAVRAGAAARKRARWEDRIRSPSVLPNQPLHVAKTMPREPLPVGPLGEELIDRSCLGRRRTAGKG